MTDLLIESIQNAILPSIRQIVFEELRNEKLQALQERYISVSELQKIAGNASRQSVDNWTKAGRFKAYFIGGRKLYKYSEVVAVLEKTQKLHAI